MAKTVQYFRNYFQKHGVSFCINMVVILILVNSISTYYSKEESKRNLKEMESYDLAIKNKSFILTALNNIDMSLRGYLLVENEAFLTTFKDTKVNYDKRMKQLDSLLPSMNVNPKILIPIKESVSEYFSLMDKIVEYHKEGNDEEALKIIKADYGTGVWLKYVEFSNKIDPIITQKIEKSQSDYQKYLKLSFIFQAITFLVGVPTLIIALLRLGKNAKRRTRSYSQLVDNNRKLIFNPNNAIDLENENAIVNEMIDNLTKTSGFIKAISEGDFQVQWEEINEENLELNKDTIAGELLLMRDRMKKRYDDAEKEQWIAVGLTQLSEIIRDNQSDLTLLNEKVIAYIIEFLNVPQAALFLVNEEDETANKYLELATCYAYGRKKFIKKRVEMGEGLIGQTYFEGEPIVLSKLPESYVNITTGQGDPNPQYFVIYPFKNNGEVVAILELSSYKKLDSFETEFLEIAGKDIAASQASIKINIQTKVLLEKSQLQEEEMKAKEEEMRQNMEELEATQEEMKRKEIELRRLLNELSSKEISN